jgi:hypothetical protein
VLTKLSVAQLRAQRNLLAIDAPHHRMAAHIAVDRVGKVHDGGAPRQRDDLAARREDVDALGEEVDLDVVPKIGGVTVFALDVEQALHPFGT